MAEENAQDSTENTFIMEAESGVIINAAQVQSIDISQKFIRVKTENGWRIRVSTPARVTINFLTSMRKFETTLLENDVIERDSDDLILLRHHPAEAYRSQRGTSPLTQTPERSLLSKSTDDRTV